MPASAGVMTVTQVINGCPDIAAARACPPLAQQFLDGRVVGPVSDGQIVNLVVAIAELAQTPRVSMPVCLNAAVGLRVLAGGVSTEDRQTQINDIADALCTVARTAAIGPAGPLLGSSASEPNADGATGPGSTDEGDDADIGVDTDDGDDTDDGIDSDGDDDTDGGDDTDDGDDTDGGDTDGGGETDGGGDSSGLGSNDASSGHASQNGQDNANTHAVDNTHGNNGN